MTIQSFSPIQTSVSNYYLNDPTSFKSGELMFSDSNPTLYAMVLRRDFEDQSRYYILENMKLSGFNNGSSYDYRIDLSNWIRIVHRDINITAGLTTNIYSIVSKDNRCVIYLIIGTTNPLVTNAGYITTLTNGQKYVSSGNIGLITGDKLTDFWIFADNSQPNIYIPSQIYRGGLLTISLTLSANILIDYMRYYDSSNQVIFGYALETDYYGSTVDYKSIVSRVPSNAVKVEVGYRLNGTLNIVTRNIIQKCATNSYVYYGTSSVLSTLNCTSKRERIENIRREEITTSNKSKLLKIEKEITYSQNTGLFLTEDKIFELSSAPFLTEFDSTFSPTKWLIANETFEGYNTKQIGARNIVLNLKKDQIQERYTSFENKFYS